MQHKNAAYFKRVEDFIEKYIAKNAVFPTNREIAEGTGLSPATVCRYMKVMRDENVLEYSGIRDVTTRRQREIRTNTSTPIPVLGAVSCGVPKFAEENIEEYVTLPISLFGKGDFFILRANGDSMKGAGIDNGDLVLIRQQCTAEPGDIVVALMGEEEGTAECDRCGSVIEYHVRKNTEVIRLKSYATMIFPDEKRRFLVNCPKCGKKIAKSADGTDSTNNVRNAEPLSTTQSEMIPPI